MKILGRLRGYAVAGVEPEIMGIGPAVAIPAVLKATGLKVREGQESGLCVPVRVICGLTSCTDVFFRSICLFAFSALFEKKKVQSVSHLIVLMDSETR